MPDGIVDIVPTRGVIGKVNERDPRFTAFLNLESTEQVLAFPSRPIHDRSLPVMLGRVAMISVFLGRDGRTWTDREIAAAHAAMIEAGLWLEREADRYKAPLNVSLAEIYFVADAEEPDDVEMTFVVEGSGKGPIEARAVTKALIDLSRAAAQLGFQNAQDWVARINSRVEADVHVWILHPLRMGRSLAIPLDLTELEGVSLAVCYAKEASFPEPLSGFVFTDPVTIVHELMHLFGATDKYGTPLGSFPADSVTSHDIMRLSKTQLSRLRVDPRTAVEIGWAAGP